MAHSTHIKGIPIRISATKYGIMKAPPPFWAAWTGKRRKFPMPMAFPARARINPILVPHLSRRWHPSMPAVGTQDDDLPAPRLRELSPHGPTASLALRQGSSLVSLGPDAGDPVIRRDLSKLRDALAALRDGHGTSGMEDTAGGRVQRTGDFAPENDALAFRLDCRVRNGNGGEEGLRVRVEGGLVEVAAAPPLQH